MYGGEPRRLCDTVNCGGILRTVEAPRVRVRASLDVCLRNYFTRDGSGVDQQLVLFQIEQDTYCKIRAFE